MRIYVWCNCESKFSCKEFDYSDLDITLCKIGSFCWAINLNLWYSCIMGMSIGNVPYTAIQECIYFVFSTNEESQKVTMFSLLPPIPLDPCLSATQSPKYPYASSRQFNPVLTMWYQLHASWCNWKKFEMSHSNSKELLRVLMLSFAAFTIASQRSAFGLLASFTQCFQMSWLQKKLSRTILSWYCRCVPGFRRHRSAKLQPTKSRLQTASMVSIKVFRKRNLSFVKVWEKPHTPWCLKRCFDFASAWFIFCRGSLLSWTDSRLISLFRKIENLKASVIG